MDLTVLNLAIPSLSADLRHSSAQLLWIVDVYGFLVAGSLITMGTLGDRIGRRKLLLIGAAAFGAASIVAAFSRSAEMLIATRAILGLAGATLAPSTLSLIRNMFLDPQQRTFAIGVWISSYSAGAAIGPLVGGALLTHYWWGSAFLIGVPVMVLLLVLGPILLPEYRDPAAGRLDVISAAQSLGCVLLVIFGLKEIAQDGVSWMAAVAIATGVVMGVAFVRRQRRLADPLIDLRLFRAPTFSAALATYTIGTFIAFGAYVFIAQYFQLVLGMSPLQAGLWTVPFALAFIVGSMLTPMIVRRFRPASVVAAGLGVASVGFGMLTFVHDDPEGGLGTLITGFVIYSLGLAPVFTLATDLIVGGAPAERAGAASAISETGSELGGALGIAILGSIGTAVYRQDMANASHANVPQDVMEAARSTLGGAIAVAERLPADVGARMLESARASFTDAFTIVACVCAFTALAMAVVAVITLRRSAAPTNATHADALTDDGI
jgi:MFS transporter, DHA2 family, multidrug resistance protein